MSKLRANQTLLLTYPDLYGAIPQLDENEMNVCDDMINQCSANKLRIELLENLNRKLENSIKKLNENQVRINSTNNWQSRLETRTTTPQNLPQAPLPPPQNDRQSANLEQLMQPAADSSYLTSSSLSSSKMPAPLQMQRPVPLFKLENELVPQQQQQSSAK